MALETLKDIKEIRGVEIKKVIWNHPENNFIEVNNLCNCITFKIQDGPIKENGFNGCDIVHIIEVAKQIVIGLNKKFECQENRDAIQALNNAIDALDNRKKNREERGVEGHNCL